MELYLIRHTTPDVQKGLCYGQSDIDVNATLFESELNIIKTKIPAKFDKVYSSPLKRCVKLAESIADDFERTDLLKELDFGDWEMKHWNTIPQSESEYWTNDFVHAKTPNGESYYDLHERTKMFITSLPTDLDCKVAVVTHSGNIRSLLCYYKNSDLINSFDYTLDYGAVLMIKI